MNKNNTKDCGKNESMNIKERIMVRTSKFTKAFTLAEVLITLGIIGVVAALTIPGLINKYKKMVISTKLKKFYSTMNEAVNRSIADNGEIKNWLPVLKEGEPTQDVSKETFIKYLKPYISNLNNNLQPSEDKSYVHVALKDGSGFVSYQSAYPSEVMWFFYCLDYKDCKPESFDGEKTFLFVLCDKGFKAGNYCEKPPASREIVYNNCNNPNKRERHACTALIQYDNWEIKDDYPWIK